MNVISIGTDRKIFEENSAVRQRAVEYASLFDELHIVVFTTRKFTRQLAGKQSVVKIGSNLYLYPTNSLSKLLYIHDAMKISKRIVLNSKFLIHNSVITVQDPFETGLVGVRLKKKFGLGLHVQVHTDVFNPYFAKLSVLNRLRVRMAKKVLPQADAVRTVSERIASSLKAKSLKLKADISVLPIFVDLEKYKQAEVSIKLKEKYSQFDFILLVASRLTREKNISMAIEATAKLVKAYPKLGLVIVGEGPERNNLKLKAKSLQLESNVVFEPWTNDLISYYKTADVFLITSWFEGYSMAIIEAVASHCPVVSTDVGIAKDVLDESSVCPVGNVECFSESVSRLIQNNSQREKMVNDAFGRLPRVALGDKKEYLEMYKNDIARAGKIAKNNEK